mmetsp:Transcript_48424/g.85325  ORF Transcript_48424/g.85325 Transcript_48424/m.85325 type:complete len:98 (-) Transcript_48424:926-1219(-)
MDCVRTRPRAASEDANGKLGSEADAAKEVFVTFSAFATILEEEALRGRRDLEAKGIGDTLREDAPDFVRRPLAWGSGDTVRDDALELPLGDTKLESF